jgi:hypothetical protein
MLTTAQVAQIADRILRDRLGTFGYDRVEVQEGSDEDDRPALFLKGIMREDAPLVPGDRLNATLFAVNGALLEEHEERFPYFVLTRENDESPETRPNRAI